jgi:hypothetical protein
VRDRQAKQASTTVPEIADDTDYDPAAAHDAARDVSLTDLRRQIQKRAAAAAPGEDVHAAAERGVASPSTALPFADRIQASFGPAHDVSAIRAHVGGDAASAMGATAFATGNDVVFDRSPDLHTAAHEAAHVIQQAQGVNLYGGVGEAGDSYERHADAVADRVVAGQSAADLLGPAATGPSSKAVQMNPKVDPATKAQTASQDAMLSQIRAVTKRMQTATVVMKELPKAKDIDQKLDQIHHAYDGVLVDVKALGGDLAVLDDVSFAARHTEFEKSMAALEYEFSDFRETATGLSHVVKGRDVSFDPDRDFTQPLKDLHPWFNTSPEIRNPDASLQKARPAEVESVAVDKTLAAALASAEQIASSAQAPADRTLKRLSVYTHEVIDALGRLTPNARAAYKDRVAQFIHVAAPHTKALDHVDKDYGNALTRLHDEVGR